MNFAADTAAFITDFAIGLTVAGVPVRGIVDNGYAQAFGGMVSGTAPSVTVASTVVATRGDAVTIGGEAYVVTGVEPDGTGITTLRLDKA